jgi:hypothetical protein
LSGQGGCAGKPAKAALNRLSKAPNLREGPFKKCLINLGVIVYKKRKRMPCRAVLSVSYFWQFLASRPRFSNLHFPRPNKSISFLIYISFTHESAAAASSREIAAGRYNRRAFEAKASGAAAYMQEQNNGFSEKILREQGHGKELRGFRQMGEGGGA